MKYLLFILIPLIFYPWVVLRFLFEVLYHIIYQYIEDEISYYISLSIAIGWAYYTENLQLKVYN